MLTALSVRDVVLIDRLELAFGAGLTVLTGETGAGKSILLDSLGLALGERGTAGLVREGAEGCGVTATFTLPPGHPAAALLVEAGLDAAADDTLVLRRAVSREGRSRAFVNDEPISLALLRRLATLLVEIQGQHEQMGLADAATHRSLLDAFGVAPSHVAEVAALFAAWSDARRAVDAAEQAIAEAAREEDWLRAAVAELSTLAPEPDEEDGLAGRRLALQNGERRAEAIAASLAELAPRDRRDRGPAAALRAAARALGRVAADDGAPGASSLAHEALARIEQAEDALADAEQLLSRLAGEADRDPRTLETVEERLFALRAAARKHGVQPADLAAHLTSLRAQLARLESGARDVAVLRERRDAARAAFDASARLLSERRAAAARRLETAVEAELAPLRLARARFVVRLETLDEARWTEHGADDVTFFLAANPGQAPAPLGRAASGGELSRIMLALKVVLAAGSPSGTLVFDEIDQGVGGATASAVGERLALVARQRQVLVVTHAPQVAARADHHLVVSKHVHAERTTTRIASLGGRERREEIARMLAGETVTDAARRAAASLLDGRQSALEV